MLKIGDYNTLKVSRLVDFGAYLDAGNGTEILIPAKFMPDNVSVGDMLDVFVYTDSEDRLIATTEKPYAVVGQFTYLQVMEVNKVGAFLDWGLEAKDILAPYSEQKYDMRVGCFYLVYLYLDDTTKRVVASTKINKFIGNVVPRYRHGDKVEALVYEHTPIGYKCIVDNLHYGMIYENELFRPVELEERIIAYVSKVRDDGKIDLTLSDKAGRRTGALSDTILDRLQSAGGRLPVSDKSSPEEIKRLFSCSKRDFKQAIGHLYKDRKIVISPCEIILADK